jgi:hypothetical protein
MKMVEGAKNRTTQAVVVADQVSQTTQMKMAEEANLVVVVLRSLHHLHLSCLAYLIRHHYRLSGSVLRFLRQMAVVVDQENHKNPISMVKEMESQNSQTGAMELLHLSCLAYLIRHHYRLSGSVLRFLRHLHLSCLAYLWWIRKTTKTQ